MKEGSEQEAARPSNGPDMTQLQNRCFYIPGLMRRKLAVIENGAIPNRS